MRKTPAKARPSRPAVRSKQSAPAKRKTPSGYDWTAALQREQRELLREVAALQKKNDDETIDLLDARLSRHAIAKEMLYGAYESTAREEPDLLRAREEWAIVEMLLGRLRRAPDERQRGACATLLHDWLKELFAHEAKLLSSAGRMTQASHDRLAAEVAAYIPVGA